MNPQVLLLTRAVSCGGVSTFLFRLGRQLRERGCEVEIVATEERGAWFDLAAAEGLSPTLVDGAARTPPRTHARRVGRFLRERDPDVVFLNHALPAQVALGMLPDRTFVVPILHNDIDEVVRVAFGNPDAWNVAVTVSPGLQEIARARRPGRPSEMIAHGIEIPEETPAWIEAKATTEPLRLVYVGALEEARKGVFQLPRILRGLLDRGHRITLTIAGDGPDVASLAAGAAALGVSSDIQALGVLDPARVRSLLADAHVLLLPSRHEGFGLVLVEAQACGCVPVASRLPGITDFAVEDGTTGLLVEFGDVTAAVDAIEGLEEDRTRWRAMAEAGYARVRERFDVGRMGEDYFRLIRDGMAGRHPLPGPRSGLPPIDRELLTWRDSLPPPVLAALRRWKRGSSDAAHPK